ncbi:MAG: type IV pilus biogenesis/stability protein PilW [Burkholderiaceae bacterium]|nr:type IV pilus biogenesis/stability protein PilW [Burkholderiaceae bacterium]
MNVIWGRLCCGLAIAVITLIAGCASGPGDREGELQTLSDQSDAQKRAAIRMQLAVGYYEGHQWPVALDEIKQALNIYPDYADAYGMRALIYMEMGESHRAEENFNRALALAPKNPDLSNNYGWFLCKEGREAQAMPYFEASFSNRSYRSPAKALNNAGLCSLKLKDVKAAEKFFGRAFQVDPSNPVTNGNLAKIYYDRKDYERARFYIDRVIKANILAADVLWLAIKIEHKSGDRDAEATHAKQLQRRHPNSPEYAAYQRRAFDE